MVVGLLTEARFRNRFKSGSEIGSAIGSANRVLRERPTRFFSTLLELADHCTPIAGRDRGNCPGGDVTWALKGDGERDEMTEGSRKSGRPSPPAALESARNQGAGPRHRPAARTRLLALPASSLFGGRDVLVQAEEVLRIVLLLQRGQPVVVVPVGRLTRSCPSSIRKLT